MPEPVQRESLGARIRRLREQRGWSLSDLAAEAKIARSYLYQIEQNKSAPTQATIEKLANALNALPGQIWSEETTLSEVPESLQRFADQMKLGPADIQMLAQIQYRGRRPSTTREWQAIYSIIRAMLDEEDKIESESEEAHGLEEDV